VTKSELIKRISSAFEWSSQDWWETCLFGASTFLRHSSLNVEIAFRHSNYITRSTDKHVSSKHIFQYKLFVSQPNSIMWHLSESSRRDDSNEWGHHRVWLRNKKVSILDIIFILVHVTLDTRRDSNSLPNAQSRHPTIPGSLFIIMYYNRGNLIVIPATKYV